jgi:hypothetical protein
MLLFLCTGLFFVSGCTSATYPVDLTPISSGALDEFTPIDTFTLSHAPKIGETAVFSFSIEPGFYTSNPQNLPEDISNVKARVWVEFLYANTQGSYSEAKYGVIIPYDEVLVSGQLTWEGNPFDTNGALELGGMIQLPREGVWEITGYVEAAGFDNPYMVQTFNEYIRIAVTEDVAAAMRVINAYPGPLEYLDNFSYGQSTQRDPDERFDPVILGLDISKIPSIGEVTILSCRIRSIVDAPDYSVQIIFAERLKGNATQTVPGDSILVEGDLAWIGDLKKNEPVEFTAIITFPEEGEWRIRAEGDCSTNDKLAFADSIEMNITGDISSYGWEE